MRDKTLIEMLASRTDAVPDSLCVRFLRRSEVTATLTFAQTWHLASRWAALFVEHGVGRGQAVILALPNTEDFVGAYFGTLLAGGIPAPMAPVRRAVSGDPYLTTVARRLKTLQARVCAVPEGRADLGTLAPLSTLEHLAVVSRRDLPPDPPLIAVVGHDHDLGLLQFTSGTSGQAKGVQLSHSALLAQLNGISRLLGLRWRQDTGVSWLPLFHDMGLIGFLLTPLYNACEITLLPAEDFMLAPKLWMKAVSDFRATITGGPPSAYLLCARHTKDSDIEQMDLHDLRCALVGAEMILPESLDQFVARFGPAGFRATSLMPAYGMAENGLAVTIAPPGQGPVVDLLDLDRLQTAGRAEPVAQQGLPDRATRAVASVGVPLPHTTIAIVDKEGQPLGERQVGEILVRSSSLMQGYYRQPESTHHALREGWLWTGDLGYCAGGRLYITGRKKEILIVGGRNYYPDDLESVAGSVPGVRAGRAVAIACEDPLHATEVVVVLVETSLKEQTEREELRQHVRQTLVQAGFPVREVVLLRPKTIQTTLNGKLKRLECKERYLAGTLP
ncbi:MAG: AMP-binding protein [Ardenticatenaceae bacterium]|nr:AMP-binding protein [Ardenticatenaceae bacterium]